jgi:hypothetical protein
VALIFAMALNGCGGGERPAASTGIGAQQNRSPADIANPNINNLLLEANQLFAGPAWWLVSSELHAIFGDLTAQPQNTLDAQQRALMVIGMTIETYGEGGLQGGQSQATTNLALAFIIELARYVGFPLPPIDPSALTGGEATIQPCFAAMGCQVTVPSNNARITIPPGALAANTLVTIFRLVDNAEEVDAAHHDAAGNKSYPLAYDFSTVPVATLQQNATFEICYYDSGPRSPVADGVLAQVQIAHYKTPTPDLFPRAQGTLACGTTAGHGVAIAGTGGGFSPYKLALAPSQAASLDVGFEDRPLNATGTYHLQGPPAGSLYPFAYGVVVVPRDSTGAAVSGVSCSVSVNVPGVYFFESGQPSVSGITRFGGFFPTLEVTYGATQGTLTATCGGLSKTINILVFYL